MNKFIEFLESDATLLRAAIMLMLIYAVHNAYILHELEHIEVVFTIFGSNVNIIKPIVSIGGAFITEFVILVLFVKGEKLFGHLYAVGLFGLNTFYYCYFMPVFRIELVIVSVFVSFIHFAAIWYLSDIFYSRRQQQLADQKAILFAEEVSSQVKQQVNEHAAHLISIIDERSQSIKCDITEELVKKFHPDYINELQDGQGEPSKQQVRSLANREGEDKFQAHLTPPSTGLISKQKNSSEKPFKCEHCGLGFTRKFTLERHIENFHAAVPALSTPE